MKLNLDNFHRHFGTNAKCYDFIVKQRWPDGLACLSCGSEAIYTCQTRRLFKCKDCKRQFSPLVDSIFQDTHIALRKWFLAIYLITDKGITSIELARRIGVTQKTAWHLGQRIKEALANDALMLEGVVQIDEMYVGPRAIGRSSARYSKKYGVMGAVESRPGGKMVLQVVKQPDATVARQFIERYIKPGTLIHTDESRIYRSLKYTHEHDTVNHSQRQYVFNGVTTNKAENLWMHGKRLLKGVHIRVLGKHLAAYLRGGYQFRYNNRDLNAEQRIKLCLRQGWGKVLTYKQLKERRATQPMPLRGWARKRAAMPVQMSLF